MREEWYEELVNTLEAAPLALATRFGPWLTPLVPAFFVHRAMMSHLNTPVAWAWIAAVALEIVGIAATNSLLRAYQWEQERRKSDPAAPIVWNVIAATVYYGTAFLMVLFLEIWPDVVKFAPAFFVVLSGTSALVMALTGDQRRRERLVSQMSAKRQPNTSATRHTDRSLTGETVNNDDTDLTDRLQAGRKAKQQQAESALLTYIADNPDAPHSQIAQAVNRSRPWVSGKLTEWEEAGVIQKNGHGYVIVGGLEE